MAARAGKTKSQRGAEEIARAVNTGKAHALETVDFSDPDRPKTCLEVDFPILPVNQVATIEGNAGKPIYQVAKWWARRRSSVFRSMLIAAAVRAPDDRAETAKVVWDSYYGNHQKKGSFSDLKVADIFMGGGTTIVEGSRLGMNMYGTDLNPVAWFIVKNALTDVKQEEVESLLSDIEASVKPQIMPFYACYCPRGHRGTWKRVSTGAAMDEGFAPLALTSEERDEYSYSGPEIIYVFWAKHGPCQVTGCGHRTPIMLNPVASVKTITVKAWDHICPSCKKSYDVEEKDVRMAPGASLVVAESEKPFAPLAKKLSVTCPHCSHHESLSSRLGKAKKKKISLSLLVHPQWLKGEPGMSPKGAAFGGSATDDAHATASWNAARANTLSAIEVRGLLPKAIVCPDTGVTIKTGKDGGTVPKKSSYACGACGTVQDVLTTIKATGKSGPVAAYAIQGYCPACESEKQAYGGRFFAPAIDTSRYDAAAAEWENRRNGDLADFWPKSELPYGFMTHKNNGGIPNHGYTHWWTMFNPRQLLVHSQLLNSICSAGEGHRWETREYVLSAFQQYLRNQTMFCIWNLQGDKLEPMFSNSNFHPKATVVENCVFQKFGRGNWTSCSESLLKTIHWAEHPWELVSTSLLAEMHPQLAGDLSGKSEKTFPHDPVDSDAAELASVSATELANIENQSFDLVVTDPPFGGLLHYSELSDFFYVWLRLVLKDRYPEYFTPEHTPKTLEAVANRARHPEDPDAFYQRLLTECWREAHRILKPGGLLTFTFHHSEDAPWVAVLESLFDAEFYLEAAYPIRSDETKGDGAKPGTFGSQKIEYDVIHVCRKRREEPKPVSWAKMRRQVITDVRQLRTLLEHHQKEGLPEADLQVIRRGKALEYYSRHYGKVYVDEGKPISVQEALLGINQILDEELGIITDPPPTTAEPFTRQFLRIFDGQTEVPRDQMQKYLRGTGISPGDFEERGWCFSENKIYRIVSPVKIAQDWAGKHRRGMVSDYDQAAFLIGACFDNSGINATDTLTNTNFKPHPALGALLDWYSSRGSTTQIRNAAIRARSILRAWKSENQQKVQQMTLFFEEETVS